MSLHGTLEHAIRMGLCQENREAVEHAVAAELARLPAPEPDHSGRAITFEDDT